MKKEINRTQLNSIANKVKKVLKNGIKDCRTISNVIFSNDIEDILGDGDAFGFDDITHYDFVLGEFDGRITRANLDKEKVKPSECSRIDTSEVVLTIEKKPEENKVTAFARVGVDWCNKCGNWNWEFIKIKEWELI